MSQYQTLTRNRVNAFTDKEAERVLQSIIAERGTVTGGGTILRFSEFNENPDPLVGELLARILIAKIDPELLIGLTWNQIVVMSIENSAAYIAGAITYEVADVFALERPPRIIRARKLPKGETPSPAMGSNRVVAEVRPITAGGESRYLVSSVPSKDDLSEVKVAIVVDDFRATGSTLAGDVKLCREMIGAEVIIPVAALGKPQQETVHSTEDSGVLKPLTALDVSFWGDPSTGKAFIKANGFEPEMMLRATANDFVSKETL